MARQCLPLRQKIMECSIISPALSILMKHLVIGELRKAPNFSVFHWSLHGSLVSIGQHFVTTRAVNLPQCTEMDRNKLGVVAMVLGKHPVLGHPPDLDNSRAWAYCTCSWCGWGLFGHFFSHLSFLSSFSVSLGDGPI